MTPSDRFQELLQQLRAGDSQAAEALYEEYGSAIRREARLRLRDPAARRLQDSEDIVQQAVAAFVLRVAVGECRLDSPEDLRRLLMKIVRNIVATGVRRQHADRRSGELRRHDLEDGMAVPRPTPSQVAVYREQLDLTLARFTSEERRLVDLRLQGFQWDEIAQRLGGMPESLRIKHGRAVERVAREMGWGEGAA